jgi:hypothetical protein
MVTLSEAMGVQPHDVPPGVYDQVPTVDQLPFAREYKSAADKDWNAHSNAVSAYRNFLYMTKIFPVEKRYKIKGIETAIPNFREMISLNFDEQPETLGECGFQGFTALPVLEHACGKKSQ